MSDAPLQPSGPTSPLADVRVSIVVATFNSDATVVETLDSILAQRHGRLELFVCDDASTDGTSARVANWLALHGHRFERAELLTTPVNLGVCRNVARAYALASGRWLKTIAGDDVLVPEAIDRMVEAGERFTDTGVVVSSVFTFSTSTPGSARTPMSTLPSAADATLFELPAAALVRALAARNFIPAPGSMVHAETLRAIGGVDLAFTHLEDWPMWMRMASSGVRFVHLNEALVGYRVSAGSISAGRGAQDVDPRYLQDLQRFYSRFQRQHLPALARIDRAIEIFRWGLAAGTLRKHRGLYRFTAALHLLSPRRWVSPTGRGRRPPQAHR